MSAYVIITGWQHTINFIHMYKNPRNRNNNNNIMAKLIRQKNCSFLW